MATPREEASPPRTQFKVKKVKKSEKVYGLFLKYKPSLSF